MADTLTPILALTIPDLDGAADVAELSANFALLERTIGPVFNPLAFGAVGDGVTSDTAAFRLAMAAAVAYGGGVVEVTGGPTKAYALGPSAATYSLTLGSRVTIRGDGATLTRAAGNTEKLLGAATALTDVRVEGVTIDNADAAIFSGGVLFVPNGSSRIAVERVRFVGLGAATAVQVDTGPVQSSHVRIADCEFVRTSATTTAAAENIQTVGIYDASYVWVERCRFHNCNALHLEAANATACPTTDPMRHVHLRGCSFERIKCTCVFVTPGSGTTAAMAHVRVEDNSFLNIGKEIEKGALLVGVAGTITGVIVRGNTVRDFGYTGSSGIGATPNAATAIAVGSLGAVVVEGVVIEGNRVDGATLGGVVPPTGNYGIGLAQNVRHAVVRGNVVQNCGYDGIWLTSSAGAPVQHVLVAGNVIRSCALHTDALLRGGGIHVVDYVNFLKITDNLCVDNGAGGGGGGMEAGIAIDTPTTSSTVSDLTIDDNTCTDTRVGGAKTQLYGIRIGETDGTDTSQPARISAQGNQVTGNATAGFWYQTSQNKTYYVANNQGWMQGSANSTMTGSIAANTNAQQQVTCTGLRYGDRVQVAHSALSSEDLVLTARVYNTDVAVVFLTNNSAGAITGPAGVLRVSADHYRS